MQIEQYQMRDDHGVQNQELRLLQAIDEHVHPPLNDVLEQAIKRLGSWRSQCVKHFLDFDATISMEEGPRRMATSS